jgi:ribonuclease P protein component
VKEDVRRRTFRPADRIRRRSEYMAVQSTGQRVHTPHLIIIVLPRTDGKRRLGITVTKKVSKSAVRRNRVKRLVREVFRNHRALFPEADVVVIAKRGATDLELDDVLSEVRGVERAMRAAARAGRAAAAARGTGR